MKTTILFPVLAFALAIGGAFVARHFATGYSRKADVAGQVFDCQVRGLCSGTTVICTVEIESPHIIVDLYDASTGTCGNILLKD